MNRPRFQIYHLDRVAQEIPHLGFDLGDALIDFNFFPFIHDTNKEAILKYINPKSKKFKPEHLGLFCDILSSLSAQLIYRGLLDSEFTSKALQFFDKALKGYGFQLEPFEHINEIHSPSDDLKSILLIPGCQNQHVRNCRVDGGYAAVKAVHDEQLDIVFSGLHPPTDTDAQKHKYPEEFQEARSMRSYFYDLANSDEIYDKGYWSKVVIEEQSTNTDQNIRRFIEQELANNIAVHLWVSSSTFHLPRIARTIFALRNELDLKIEKISLIAAEDEKSNIVLNQVYAKQMMWEMFTTFFDVFKDGRDMTELFLVHRSSVF